MKLKSLFSYKKLFTLLFAVFALLLAPGINPISGYVPAQAQSQSQELSGNIYYFWGEGCPHCVKEKIFLESLDQKYEGVKVYDFEVWTSSKNRDFMIKVGQELNANVTGVPFTVVGDRYIVGYLNDETTGAQIETMLAECVECEDVAGNILALSRDSQPAPIEEPGEAAPENIVDIHFFYSTDCLTCNQEMDFLRFLTAEDKSLNANYYNVALEKDSRALYKDALEEFGIKSTTLPLTIVGEQFIIGWHSYETTGQSLREAIKCVRENHCEDKLNRLLVSSISVSDYPDGTNVIPETLNLPVFGEIHTKDISLPLLTFIIAALDGFNPCAMWTLIFLISILLGMKDRKRMWILGSAFIVTSGAVYFLFLAAWLNLLLFLGFVFWVRVMIGLVAVGGGSYYLKEFFTAKDTTCKVTGTEKRQKTFEKIKKITHESNFWLALLGIIILAIAVNLVEFLCSAGLPAVYTQILTFSNLETWQYYMYLLFYIFIFMLDDLIVFFVAMISLKATGLSTKYSRASHLIGGVLMVIIGLLLLFKPELLMFG